MIEGAHKQVPGGIRRGTGDRIVTEACVKKGKGREMEKTEYRGGSKEDKMREWKKRASRGREGAIIGISDGREQRQLQKGVKRGRSD